MNVTPTSMMEDLIYELNMDFVASVSPTVAYLVLLMVTGVVGNTLTFLVYYTRFKPSVTRTYILAMSVCDLLSNCLALPSDIYEFRFHYDFDDEAGCKFFGYITRFLVLMSAVLLVAIAVDHWRTVCQSTKKPKAVKHVYTELICLTVFSACYAVSFGVLREIQTIPIQISNITGNISGSTCSIADMHVGSCLIVIYNASSSLNFIICVIIMFVCYALIGRHLWLHKKRLLKNAKIRPNQRSDNDSSNTSQGVHKGSVDQRGINLMEQRHEKSEKEVEYTAGKISIAVDSWHSMTTSYAPHYPTDSCLQTGGLLSYSLSYVLGRGTTSKLEPESCPGNANIDDVTPGTSGITAEMGVEKLAVRKLTESAMVANACKSSTPQSQVVSGTNKTQSDTKPTQKLPTRTTLMMFILTALYVLSYLPHLSMAAMYRGKMIKGVSFWVKNVHQITMRSIFINSVVNPLVYSYCSVMFRRECYLFLCRK